MDPRTLSPRAGALLRSWRRLHDPTQDLVRRREVQIVREGLQPSANVAEIGRRDGVHSAQFYEWKQKALASMKAGLKGPGGNPDPVLRQENLRL